MSPMAILNQALLATSSFIYSTIARLLYSFVSGSRMEVSRSLSLYATSFFSIDRESWQNRITIIDNVIKILTVLITCIRTAATRSSKINGSKRPVYWYSISRTMHKKAAASILRRVLSWLTAIYRISRANRKCCAPQSQPNSTTKSNTQLIVERKVYHMAVLVRFRYV